MQWHNREPTYHENIKHGAPMIFLNYPSKEYIASHLPTKPKSQSPTPYHTAVPTRLEKKKEVVNLNFLPIRTKLTWRDEIALPTKGVSVIRIKNCRGKNVLRRVIQDGPLEVQLYRKEKKKTATTRRLRDRRCGDFRRA